jgi:hypothetical protein
VRIIKENDGVFAFKKKTFAHSLFGLAKVHRLLESVLESVTRWFDWRRWFSIEERWSAGGDVGLGLGKSVDKR